MVKEYEEKLEEFTAMEMEINGIKPRTAKGIIQNGSIYYILELFLLGYAIKDVAVHWLMKEFPGTFQRLNFSWDDYVKVKIFSNLDVPKKIL